MSDLIKCSGGCGRVMGDAIQIQEQRAEIMASGASMEGRMSDYNNITTCSYCLRVQAERQERREYDGYNPEYDMEP